MRRTRIIRQDRLWDIFQKFVDNGLVISKFEKTIGAKSGYIRSVKSKKRIPKYKTYKAISDSLRDYVRITPDKYRGFITNDDLDFILDPLYINEEISKRKCKIVDLANAMSQKDHTVGERLRYWKNQDFEMMTISSIRKFEIALNEYDRLKSVENAEERESKPKWDFKAERQRYLQTGHFHHLEGVK